MAYTQVDMFQNTPKAREAVSSDVLARVRQRLEAVLVRLQAESQFCWDDELAAIHEENGFRAAATLLGEEGEALWARFDAEMDRLYRSVHDGSEIAS
ncbi:hypothetical protein [Novosphingopyxis baekryungensis]|uniref:hypothetical protein n=1 Tax=Novosphingopyxis baekryungensis TaxID=279369 RepID=UPI0003B3F7E1|nr:hypothetical protein [Novosphingopyxis baekryungensis]